MWRDEIPDYVGNVRLRLALALGLLLPNDERNGRARQLGELLHGCACAGINQPQQTDLYREILPLEPDRRQSSRIP